MNFLYWLYLWQLKEYRWDRMRAFLVARGPGGIFKDWLVGSFRRPQTTVKILITGVLALTVLLAELFVITNVGVYWVIALIVAYFSTPIVIGLAVALLSIPSRLIVLLLFYLAVLKRARLPNLLVIGVTGSYGKTTTKEAIAGILSVKYNVLKTPGSVNTVIGIARQILFELTPNVDVYVVEMGAYKQGEIAKLARMVKPMIGVITGINEQHLGLFGGFGRIKRTKLELVEALPPGTGLAVINTANKFVVEEKSRIQMAKLEYQSNQLDENVNAAVVIAKHLGLTQVEIAAGRKRISVLNKRLQIVQSAKGFSLIDNSYSSNPNGFKSALDFMVEQFPNRRKILIATGVYDLGEKSLEVNQALNNYAAKKCDEIIIVEPLHAKYFKNAQLISYNKGLYQYVYGLIDKFGSEADKTNKIRRKIVFLFEGRHRSINYVLSKLKIADVTKLP